MTTKTGDLQSLFYFTGHQYKNKKKTHKNMHAHDLLIYMRFPDITGIADDIIMAKKSIKHFVH